MVPGGACHCRAVNATAWAADCATYSIDGALCCVTYLCIDGVPLDYENTHRAGELLGGGTDHVHVTPVLL